MHRMAQALGAGLGAQALRPRIVHASIRCTGVLNACWSERTGTTPLRGVAVAGRFPPHRPRSDPAMSQRPPRAKLLEPVLKAGGVSGRRRAGRTRRADRAGRVARERASGSAHRETPGGSVDGAVRDCGAAAVSGAIFRVHAVANPAAGPPFSEPHFTLMQSLAERAALALHQAELLHLQLE